MENPQGPAQRPESQAATFPLPRTVQARQGSPDSPRLRARRLLERPDGPAAAILLAEILGAPRALRPWRPRAGHGIRAPRIGS